MNLKKKILLLVMILCVLILFYLFFVLDLQIFYSDKPLLDKSTVNLLDNFPRYLEISSNAITTKKVISSGMYTDANYKDFYAIIKLPPDDNYMKEAWKKGEAFVAFESFLQSTKEWISNNKYMITMYYYSDDEASQPVIFFQEKWVGINYRVSYKQPLPKEAKNKSIYIKFESDLGSFLFLANGNDVRFIDNYLSIQ